MGNRGVKFGSIRGPYKNTEDKKTVISVAIENNLLDKLDRLFNEKTIKSRSSIVNEAIREYLEVIEWE